MLVRDYYSLVILDLFERFQNKCYPILYFSGIYIYILDFDFEKVKYLCNKIDIIY